MISPISHASSAHTAPQLAAARPLVPQVKAQSTPTDNVQLSNAALASRAVVKEATETQAQTVKEAAGGDVQARNLLAREAAARKG
jgi:TRAP-type mannitol/chloroaromatic compound transport system substrate-binding protein